MPHLFVNDSVITNLAASVMSVCAMDSWDLLWSQFVVPMSVWRPADASTDGRPVGVSDDMGPVFKGDCIRCRLRSHEFVVEGDPQKASVSSPKSNHSCTSVEVWCKLTGGLVSGSFGEVTVFMLSLLHCLMVDTPNSTMALLKEARHKPQEPSSKACANGKA